MSYWYNQSMRLLAHVIRRALFIAFVLAIASCGRYLEKSLDSPLVDGDNITFRVKCPSASTVQLAGDWGGNNWAQGDGEAGEVLVGLMGKVNGEGGWEITVCLAPGRYRYRFLVDETAWLLDPANPRVVDDGRGGKANLLIVP